MAMKAILAALQQWSELLLSWSRCPFANVPEQVGVIKELIDDLNVRTGGHRRQHRLSTELLSVDCMEEVCAFVKKETYVVGA